MTDNHNHYCSAPCERCGHACSDHTEFCMIAECNCHGWVEPEHEVAEGGPKRPEYQPCTPHQRLAYLIEECGEVLAAAGKSMRWGYAAANPELPDEAQETNAAWLRRELADLQYAISLVYPDIIDHPVLPDEARETLWSHD
jgi:NTP pyrophosphatase (non-canonical NTP hydrolase)